MIENIACKGPLITDIDIDGERKSDGIIPAHPGCCQLSKDRFLVTVATLDPHGWDSNHSIIYQIRSGAPDGPIVKEGVLAPVIEGWDPFDQGLSLTKPMGMAVSFGVPKGALCNGKPAANANVFVIKWYRRGFLRVGDELLRLDEAEERGHLPGGKKLHVSTMRVEWAQVRLNDTDDDLEIIQPIQTLRQVGYNTDEPFCDLGPGRQMNHSMVPPIPMDDECSQWVEFCSFATIKGTESSGSVAPIRYTFNAQTGRYEWTQTGPLLDLPDAMIGESSTVRLDDGWLIAFRSNGPTYWFRCDDPFGDLGQPSITPSFPGPRHVYRYPDGVVRILANALKCDLWRQRLCIWDVDTDRIELSNERVILDSVDEGLPFSNPGLDMSKLCPNQGRRQLILFRTITLKQTARGSADPPFTPAEHDAAGVFHAEINYAHDVPDPWEF